ncbi:MAG: hypothetical protein R2777_10795, partial [Chitinophagales bacterium]
MNELKDLLTQLKNEYQKSAKDLVDWIKDDINGKGIKKGYSTATITNTKKIGEGKKYNDLIKLIKEYMLICVEKKTDKTVVYIKPKIELYYNQMFYLYFYDEESDTKKRGISRAIMTIGTNTDVYIKNVQTKLSSDYKGSVDIHSKEDHLIFMLKTITTGEKNLYMNFIISPEKVPPVAIGAYCNIDKNGALVAGSLILEHIGSKTENTLKMESGMFFPGTKEYNQLNVNIRKFLGRKELNYMKVTKGIFSYTDLADFFVRQEQKKKYTFKEATNGIFISAPMNSLPANYPSLREDILLVIAKLKEIFKCEIYFGGMDKARQEDFGYPPVSFQENFNTLDKFDKYVLFYPKKVASSVLIEAGWALKAGKNCIFFVHSEDDLPYLFQKIEYPNVRVIEYDNIDYILGLLEKHNESI